MLYIDGINDPEEEIDFLVGLLNLSDGEWQYGSDSMVGCLVVPDTLTIRQRLASANIEYSTTKPDYLD